MKKIDLHIHTTPASNKDAHFVFDLVKFQDFVDTLSIDAIAITNHNLFDLNQFNQIVSTLQNVVIFPGIEIDFEDGHLLLISENEKLDDFHQKCEVIKTLYESTNNITTAQLQETFIDLSEYLLIPHYEKKPRVKQSAIDSLSSHIFTGEVQSPKKFHRIIKEEKSLCPVLFSDTRINRDLNPEKHQGNHTYINTNSDPLTLSAVKASLRDKNKVFLTNTGRHRFFQVLNDGQELSSGLNVIIGGRSSGKTHFLNKLRDIYETEDKSIKYIEQFDLVRDDEKKFNERVEKDKSAIREKYLQEFRKVVDDVIKIDRGATQLKLEKYIETLLDFASSEQLQDEYSKAKLFKETIYQIRQNQEEELENLLKSILLLLDNSTYKSTITKYISDETFKKLFDDLTTQYKELLLTRLKKEWVNELVTETRKQLESKTSSPKISDRDIDFYNIKLERERLRRFEAIAMVQPLPLRLHSKQL